MDPHHPAHHPAHHPYPDNTVGHLIDTLLGRASAAGAPDGVRGWIRETHLNESGELEVVVKPHSPSPPPTSPPRTTTPDSGGSGKVFTYASVPTSAAGPLASRRVCALVVVDVQVDFVEGGALAVAGGAAVVGAVNALRRQAPFDLVVLTQDWHPAGHVSFASSHPAAAPFTVLPGHEPDGSGLALWPDHCVAGSRGAGFAPGLVIDGTDFVVRKGTDMYADALSGFGPAAPHEPTPLAEILESHSVNHVFVAGLATDYCVRATALDAVAQGSFDTVAVVTDAVAAVAQDSGAAALAELEAAGVALLSSAQAAALVATGR